MSSFLDQELREVTKEPLLITVRFTTSFDLLIDIPDPDQTSVIGLKHMVRMKLDLPLSQHRLRFIHSGKLLKDDDILSAILKIPLPPPQVLDPTGKGKAIEPLPSRVYVNCSIGDVLTPAELAAEAEAASLSLRKHRETRRSLSVSVGLQPLKTTTTTPRGFDRLISAGFTAGEVNQLRLQFRSIQQGIHTPDTMPSPETLLQMEDAWIDDNSGTTRQDSAGFDFGDDSLGGGAIDDLLWGNLIGFFWPLGCGFLIREHGVWSRRRQIAVITGFMFSMAFGILRVLS